MNAWSRVDALLGVLWGGAAVLFLCGAFYGRITKIALPGGAGLEMGSPEERAAIVTGVTEAIKELMNQNPDIAREAQTPEGVADIAARAATATVVAQERLAARRLVGAPVPAGRAPGVPGAQDVQRGMPMSEELVKELAKGAVQEVFESKP